MKQTAMPIDWSSLRTPLTIFVLLLISLALGPVIGIFKVGFRELAIVIVALLLGFLILVPSQRVLKFGFVLWILTFGFGWRTLYVTPYLNIHPSEVAVYLLFVEMFILALVTRKKIDFSIPLFIPILMVFAVLGVVTAMSSGRPADVILEEFKIFVALVPSYYVVKWLVVTRQDWERALLIAVLVVVYVSGLGLMDYFAPGLSRTVSGTGSTDPQYIALSINNIVSFERVGFIFYGSFTAGFVIFTFFGLSAYYFMSWQRALHVQIFLGVVLLIELAGMYLSGYRGLWYAMGVLLLAFAFVQKRAWFLLGATLVSLPFLPVNFFQRFQSLFELQYADSSQFSRMARATYALDQLRESPISGIGWGGSGYVHSDLIQIGANLGVLALACFVLWLLSIIWKMLKLSRYKSWGSGYAGALFATLCGLMVVFAGEGLIVFVQLMIPVWFLFAMAYKLIDLSAQEDAPQILPAFQIREG